MLWVSVFFCVAVLWWRLGSGLDAVWQQAEQLQTLVAERFPVAQNIYIRLGDTGFRFPDLAEAVQRQLDFRLAALGCPYRYPIISQLPDHVQRPDLYRGPPPVFSTPALSEPSASELPKSSETPERAPPEFSVQLHFWYETSVRLDDEDLCAHVAYDLASLHHNDLPFFITQAIFDILIEPDLAMWKSAKGFGDCVQDYQINFVGAEELGAPPREIVAAVQGFLTSFEDLAPLTNVTSCMETVDVSKRRVSPEFLQNSTAAVSFFFSTSLRQYASHVQGVPLFHLDKMPHLDAVPGSEYGTAYDAIQNRLVHDAYDITGLLGGALLFLDSVLGLPDSHTNHRGLRLEAAVKHYTVKGIQESLELLLSNNFSQVPRLRGVYSELCALVDTVLMEQSHDWLRHLMQVRAIHSEITGLR